MLYVIGGLATFVIGGLTGVMVAIAPFNFQAHDTFFVVAHLHTVLIGGAVFPLLAGALLLLSAGQRQDAVGAARAHRVLAGVHRLQRDVHADARARAAGHAAPRLHLSGRARLRDAEPRRRRSAPSSSPPASPSSCGTSSGRRASSRSRRATRGTPARSSGCRRCPASRGACASIPEIDSRYPLWEQPNFVRDYDEGRFYLPDAEEGRREMLVTSTHRRDAGAVHAHSRADVHHADRRGLRRRLLHLRHLQAVRAGWRSARCSRSAPSSSGSGPAPARSPRRRPRTSASACACRSTSRAATRSAGGRCSSRCSAIFTAFISLVFGYFFYWTLRDDFPPDRQPGPACSGRLRPRLCSVGAWALTALAAPLERARSAAAFYVGAGSPPSCSPRSAAPR